MKKRLSYNLGDELFHAIDHRLSFSADEIRLFLAPGEVREGRFVIRAGTEKGAEGYVTSSRPWMQCVTERFAGSADEIVYRADASGFEEGDSPEGFFRILSTQGEYRIPYRLSVRSEEQETTTLGSIENAAHFANLAKTNWPEAVRQFYRPDFVRRLSEKEPEAYAVYRGLGTKPGCEQNVEEFLIAAARKQPVEYVPQVKQIRTELSRRLLEQDVDYSRYPLRITRSGWGYTSLTVETEGDFLHTDQQKLTDEDFVGNVASINYTVDMAALHEGKNLGSILLKSPYAAVRIPVCVQFQNKPSASRMKRKEKQQLILQLMQDNEKDRTKKMPGREWIEKTGQVVSGLSLADRSDPIPSLYEIHRQLTAGNKPEALSQLRRLNERLAEHDPRSFEDLTLTQYTREEDTAYCYRLYLTALCFEEDDEQIRSIELRIREKMKRNPSNWRIAWLYMYLSEEYLSHPEKRLELLQNLFARDCRSPVLYLEAALIYEANPALLMELDDFSLQVLMYTARKDILSDNLLSQVNYLAERQRTFGGKLFRILSAGYEKTQIPALAQETLSVICSLLIKGNQTDPRYFPWYQKGVEKELQITRLFEYYMMSLPEDFEGEIPKMVLMYFAYQANLPYAQKAALYRYVSEHRDEMPELMFQYEQQINDFTMDQLSHERITKDLAALYDDYLMNHALDEKTAEKAVLMAHMCVLRTSGTGIRRAVLIYDRVNGEEVYPVENGIAYFPVYGELNHIFFEDPEGNRYAKSVPYTLDRIMDTERLSSVLSYYHVRNDAYVLSRIKEGEDGLKLDKDNAKVLLELALSGRLSERFYRQAVHDLLRFYEKEDADRDLNRLLASVSPERVSPENRTEMIGSLVNAGRNEQAYAWIRRYDTFDAEPEVLFRLCYRMIAEDSAGQDDAFPEIVHEAFLRGLYNEDILKYLSVSFDGLTQELAEIRKAMEGFDLDTGELTGRMFSQMLYTGEVLPDQAELLEKYAGKEEEDDSVLCGAVLSQSSHYCLLRKSELPATMFERIGNYGREGVPLSDACRIAYLKTLSERSGEISEQEQEVSRLFLSDLLENGIVFPFYRQFIGFVPQLQAYANETLAEYDDAQNTGRHIVFHYAMEEDGLRGEFETREMREMYEGMYVTGFTLFFGEQMHYFITDDPEEKNIVESGSIGQDARIMDQDQDRFGRVNKIAYMSAMHRNEEAFRAAGEYDHMRFLVSSLFRLEDK